MKSTVIPLHVLQKRHKIINSQNTLIVPGYLSQTDSRQIVDLLDTTWLMQPHTLQWNDTPEKRNVVQTKKTTCASPCQCRIKMPRALFFYMTFFWTVNAGFCMLTSKVSRVYLGSIVFGWSGCLLIVRSFCFMVKIIGLVGKPLNEKTQKWNENVTS